MALLERLRLRDKFLERLFRSFRLLAELVRVDRQRRELRSFFREHLLSNESVQLHVLLAERLDLIDDLRPSDLRRLSSSQDRL